jgi:hypothetical protein
LKANLERKEGLTSAAKGKHFVDTDTIYVDAPIEMGIEFLQDLRNMDDWAHLLRPNGEISESEGEFLDEYDQKVKASVQLHSLSKYYLLEQEFYYPEHEYYQRTPMLLIPASYAFADPEAPGFIMHRISFWKADKSQVHGKLQMEDFGAESMNIKRMLENKAGNLESFNRGMSYIPQ